MKACKQIACALGALMLTVSCGGDGAGVPKACVTGETQLCYCTATLQGVQTCETSGAAWSACVCGDAGASVDASTEGDAGPGGTDGPSSDSAPADAPAPESGPIDGRSGSEALLDSATTDGGVVAVDAATSGDALLADAAASDFALDAAQDAAASDGTSEGVADADTDGPAGTLCGADFVIPAPSPHIVTNPQSTSIYAFGADKIHQLQADLTWKQVVSGAFTIDRARIDSAGNALIAGTAPGTVGGVNISGKPFVAKIAATGSVLWAQARSQPATRIALDGASNALLVEGQQVTKLDTKGAPRWTRDLKSLTGISLITLRDIAIDGVGDIYLAADHYNYSYYEKPVIVKVKASDGSLVWVRIVAQAPALNATRIAVSSAGAGFVAYSESTTTSPAEVYKANVTHFDGAGNTVWTHGWSAGFTSTSAPIHGIRGLVIGAGFHPIFIGHAGLTGHPLQCLNAQLNIIRKLHIGNGSPTWTEYPRFAIFTQYSCPILHTVAIGCGGKTAFVGVDSISDSRRAPCRTQERGRTCCGK